MNNYAFSNVSVTVNGVTLSGYGEGDDPVQGRRREDAYTDQVGADGKMLRIASSNESGEFIIRLQQGVSSNTYLNAIFEAQAVMGGSSIVAIGVVDTVTGDSAVGTQGYITKPADMTRGAGANDQEWVFVVESYRALFPSLQTFLNL